MNDSNFDTGGVAEQLHTVRDYIRWGASRLSAARVFFGHGTDNAIDESAALVLHALDLPPDLSPDYLSSRLTHEEKQAVLTLLQRRVQERLPAAYLTHRAWFMGLPFYVDERVLIPRSPLAELIEKRFAPWLADPDAVETVLDLGTGSGCIGIACAYAFPDADVDLCDISDDALAVAQRNVDDHDLGEQIELIRSDLFAADELQERRYDLIVSNPPYVGSDEYAALPDEYRHEPALALNAGEDGLDYVRQILRDAGDYLNDNGLLVVEVGSAQAALVDAYPRVPFIWPEFEHGGDGVFLLEAEKLLDCQDLF